ncbi:tripartite tricarboxylate transporter TctB family protein [Bacillus sinesaloumensis]|uniref:tripartite tricarboxylate transporter TctB family protein n=1 Tax=Litchfieldia sinesaloumensis TaxID=1926280 RepID=UPI00098877C3|nr:tripartite tricarboxylate transporter TctB family protein [Bacillus sinesaloumensis]
MSNVKKDYIFYSIVILFAGFFLSVTPTIKITNASFAVGPRSWPYILLTLMLIMGAYGIIKTFVKSKISKATETIEKEEPGRKVFNLSIPMLSLVTVIIYVVLLNFVGFIISTILFLYGISFLLGAKKQVGTIIFSIITTVVFVVLFSVLLQIPLPRGTGIFRELSYLFY